ncbi:hypothetical protein OEZ86_011256 [Tetradesmus obliquus]|nr:hypothetical protein OEZ86_011256 [Tetradesmus obliquus]
MGPCTFSLAGVSAIPRPLLPRQIFSRSVTRSAEAPPARQQAFLQVPRPCPDKSCPPSSDVHHAQPEHRTGGASYSPAASPPPRTSG